MVKKVSILTLVTMIMLSVSTITTDVQANIGHTQLTDLEINSLEDKAQTKLENDFENKIPSKVQYTITEAPRPINEMIEENPIGEETAIKRTLDPTMPMIAITYDDGPTKYTPEILNVLKENNSVATFFVLGTQVYNNEEVLNQMLEDGNQIGNHSYNHKKLTTISDEELYKQIIGTDDLIYIATGYTPSVMRPPYGTTSEELNKKITKPIIKWSIDTRDWENRNSEIIVNSILENAKDGDIILMHDMYDSTVEASKVIIPELINRGFQLVTIDELFEHKEVTVTAGEQYYKAYK